MEYESRGSEVMAGFISSLVNRIASEKGWQEALIADYVLREVVIRHSRDPRLIRLAFYYMGGFKDLREEDERLRREIGSMFPLGGSGAEDHRGKSSGRDLGNMLELLHIFAGA